MPSRPMAMAIRGTLPCARTHSHSASTRPTSAKVRGVTEIFTMDGPDSQIRW
jgi:hypothetical protein